MHSPFVRGKGGLDRESAAQVTTNFPAASGLYQYSHGLRENQSLEPWKDTPGLRKINSSGGMDQEGIGKQTVMSAVELRIDDAKARTQERGKNNLRGQRLIENRRSRIEDH